MRISAKADYAVRAATELASAKEGPTKGDAIARAHMMLKQRPHHEFIEVWLGNRCAYRARRDQAAA